MFFEMKKASKFLVLLLVVAMSFTGFCVPGIDPVNVYADEDVTAVSVTKVEIQGQLKVGETVTAVSTGANDEPATNVTYKWQYQTTYYDDMLEEDVVEYITISGETANKFIIPNSTKGKKIRVIANGDNGSTATSEVSNEIAADTSPDMQTLEDILKAYQWGTLIPEFDADDNIVSFLDKQIKAKGYEDVNVTLKSSSIPETVAANGDITYFYRDIDNGKTDKYIQPELVFTLSKGASSVELKKKANIYWDIDKLKIDLNKYILNNITEEQIKGENTDLNNLKSDLSLPAKINDKSYAKLHWESSNSDVLEIKTEGNAWEPIYKGIVKPGMEDKSVTLTATVEYNFTNIDSEKEEISKLKKEFPVTVKANGSNTLQEMQNELNTNYTIDKITYSTTNDVIDDANVTGDIKFLTPSKTGIANYGNYKFTVTSSDQEVLKINGYRGVIYRPLPGDADKNVNFTVTMSQRDGALSVTKDFTITVKPLLQKDINNEIKLMEKVKASYFDGIKSENTSKDNILKNMHAFREASFASDGKTLEWVYDSKDDKAKGIQPTELPGYDPMGGGSWRLFKSSRSDIIRDENLILHQPKYNTQVTIDSVLSSIEYGKYAEKYKDNEDFKKLVNQQVSAVVTVPGTDGENPNKDTDAKKLKVFASLYDGRNSFFPIPYGEIEVTAGLAKSYGYTNSHIENHAAKNEVTMLDALVAMHASSMGIASPKDEGAIETIQGMLSVGSSGFLEKVMGENALTFSLMQNGRMPNDGVYNQGYGGYTGYTVDDAVINNNDVLTYFFYQDSAYGDYYSWFEKNGTEVRELTVPKDEMLKLDLKGYMAMQFGCCTEEKIAEKTTELDGIQLVFCNQTGMLTDIEGAVTHKGKVSFAIDKQGQYIISAKGNGKIPLVTPYLKLIVTEGITDAEKQKIIAADKDALNFDDIKGANENSQSITGNLDFINLGDSGKTNITWASSDESIIAPDGTVKRPLFEAGDKVVTVTATISYGLLTDTKVIELKVAKLPSSDVALDAIVAELPATITPKEWNSNGSAKQDTNIIEMVRVLVKAKNPIADVADICVSSDEQTQIAADGTITYNDKKVKNKKVTFTIKLGSETKAYSPNVTVEVKRATKEDAFTAKWLTFDVFKGNNALENQVTSELSLPKEDTEGYYSELEWSSNNPEVIAIDSYASSGKFKAKVNRPAVGQESVKVILTAKIKPGAYWAYGMGPAGPTPEPGYGIKTFELTVQAVSKEDANTAQVLVDEAIQLFNLDKVTVRGTNNKADLMNLTYSINDIPYNWNYVDDIEGFKEEYRAATVTWTSENPGIAKVDSGAVVVRTASEQTGDIVLTISYNGKTATKRFATKILAFGQTEADEHNALLRQFAEALTFDTIKKDNTDFYKVTSDMTVVEGAEKVNGVITFGKKIYHKPGASISWTSSNPSVISKAWNGFVITRPLKDTKVTLTATLTDAMYPDCPGVQTITKEIKVIVSGAESDKKFSDAYEIMDNITAGYAAKDTAWWGSKAEGTFWHAVGMEAYRNINADTKNVISKDAKQAFVNKMIALAVEGNAKASVNANIQANVVNGLSAMGYDASQLWTVNHSKISVVDKLKAVNLEEAKTGWYSTIAPYVVTALKQGNYNTEAQENAHIEYLTEQLVNDSNWSYGVDTPAMIMQGLTAYYNRAEVKSAIDTAIKKLSAKQGANGSFGNASADAMVMVTLAQLGINPVTDERFIKEKNTLLDGLLLYKTDDNKGFIYNKEYNEISTYQGLLGLISAINVMDSGKPYNVYDFSKTAKMEAYANGTYAEKDEEPTEPVSEKEIKITFTLKSDSGTWIPKTTVNVKSDATVYHAFTKVLDEKGFTYVGAKRNYVSSITNPSGTTLAEFTNGKNSGWVYKVNGKAPNIGLMEYNLSGGDNIVWYYTNDWTKDPDLVEAAGGKSAVAAFEQTEKTTGKVEVEATTDKDGKALAIVESKDITKAIEVATKAAEKSGVTAKKEVKIVIKADSKAKEVETKMPKDSMVELNNKIDIVTVQTPFADIVFDKQNLELISKNINGDVKLSVRKVELAKEGSISEDSKSKIKEKVGDRPIFDFNLTVGDKKISNFADNVQVSVPYTASESENVNGIVVYYINDNGNLEIVKDCKYDSKTKILTFTTKHFSNYAVGYRNISFGDISKHWAKDQIVYLAARDVVKGVNNTGFAPNDKVTRAEFVQILANLSGADLSKYADSKFKDVKKEAWFANSAAWAAEAGLVTGNSSNDGTISFNPNESITRQDMAVILSRYMSKIEQKKLNEVDKEVKFTDKSQIGSYAEAAVTELQKAGVINGKTADSFAPKENATRAECAKMISVLMQSYL